MSTTDTFTSSGTWTCPAYVSTVWARCWGGGGSGGGITATPSTTLAGGGGAGGSFAEKVAYPVTPGITYTVTVGAVRTGSTGSGAAGNDSWFDNATTGVKAKGGAGGSSPVVDGASGLGGGGSTTGCVGDNVWAGGSGANGLSGNTSSFVGSGGGGAGSGAAGNPGSGTSGGGGGSASGGSGGNGRTSAGAGSAGSVYGGGGSGAMGSAASHSFAGGNGAPGRMELEYSPSFSPGGGGIRATAQTFVDVTAAPSIIDTVTPVSGDIFLLLGNLNGTTDGLWTWASAGAPMTSYSGDADGSFRDVREGTGAGARVFITSTFPLNPSVVPLFGIAYYISPTDPFTVYSSGVPAIPGGYVGISPAVTSGNPWVVPHNLGSKFLICAIAKTASTFNYVTTWDIQRTDLNTVTVIVGSTIAAGDYEIMIRKAV